MSDISESMDNFFTALDQNGFTVYNEVLIEGDVSSQVANLLSRRLPKDKLLLFRIREDITRLCREKERRVEEFTGEPSKIHDDCIVAVFIWNQMIDFVPDLKYSAKRWTRYFRVDIHSPCLICTEKKKNVTMCTNCASIICLECDTKIDREVCPSCRTQVSCFM